MGLLDQVIGSLGNRQEAGGAGALVEIAASLLQQHGGLEGLLGRFQQAGLGDHAASWVGTGQNMPIDAAEVTRALGSELIGTLAGRAGLDHSELASGLARALPQLIDQITPQGTTEGSSALLQQGLSVLDGLLGSRPAR